MNWQRLSLVSRFLVLALLVAAGSFAKTTGAAPVTQSITGLLFQPKVVILFWSDNTVVDTWSIDVMSGIGISTDPSNSKCIAATGDDGAALDDIRGRAMALKVCRIVSIVGLTTTTTLAEANLDAFLSDGFRLNWTTNDAVTRLIGYVALGGDDLISYDLINWQMPTSAGDKVITGLSFQPTLALHFHVGADLTGSPPVNNEVMGALAIGAMDGTNQWACAYLADSDSSSIGRGFINDGALVAVNTGGSIVAKAAFSSWNSDGFTLNFSTAPATAGQVISLCLRGPRVKVGDFTKSTSGAPATQDISVLPMTNPSVVLLGGTQQTGVGGSTEGRFALGVITSGVELAYAQTERDGDFFTLSDEDSIFSTTKSFIKANVVATTEAAADGSLLSSDFRLVWNPNDGSATRVGYVALAQALDVSQQMAGSQPVVFKGTQVYA